LSFLFKTQLKRFILFNYQTIQDSILSEQAKQGPEIMLFKRSGVDRRSEINRRKVYSIDYFIQGGVERRSALERRKNRRDRRNGWVRVNEWISVPVVN